MTTMTPASACRSHQAARDVSWQQARELAHAAARPLPDRDVPLAQASGLTLAGDVRAQSAMPAFDTAAMDGYAVAGLGTEAGPWRVVGVARAGAVWAGAALAAGQAVEISTGAPVPAGAHAVVPIERTVVDGTLVHAPAPRPGEHIRRAGEDAPAGTCMASAGTRIGPALLGLAAACGYDALPVRPAPRVRVLITGDELVGSGQPRPGCVRDALGPLLPPLIAALGGQATGLQHVPDRPAGLLAAAVHASQDAEVIVVTGSTSVGATDQLRHLLADSGARWVVDTVACRPGHPQLLAELADGRQVIGLPGNPYAALVAAHTLLGPLLDGLSGRPLPALPLIPVHGDAASAGRLTRLMPVTWAGSGARIIAGHRAAFLRGAAHADALAALPPGWTPGEPAPLLLLPR